MESKILLGRILQRLIDLQCTQVEGYNRFGLVGIESNKIIVSRENGKDTSISFAKIIKGIEAYQQKPELYEEGPIVLRAFGITHITSPVFALLHLLKQSDY